MTAAPGQTQRGWRDTTWDGRPLGLAGSQSWYRETKGGSMATITERSQWAEAAEEELLAGLMGDRAEEDTPIIEHPLLIAALMRRRRERGERTFEHPLLLAAMMRRRKERGERTFEHPLLLAALMRRRE